MNSSNSSHERCHQSFSIPPQEAFDCQSTDEADSCEDYCSMQSLSSVRHRGNRGTAEFVSGRGTHARLRAVFSLCTCTSNSCWRPQSGSNEFRTIHDNQIRATRYDKRRHTRHSLAAITRSHKIYPSHPTPDTPTISWYSLSSCRFKPCPASPVFCLTVAIQRPETLIDATPGT